MEELNRNIDQLFTKAKTARTGMSIEQVKLGIAVSTVAGATAATGLITKLKLISIMIVSGLAVTATVVLLSSNFTESEKSIVPITEVENEISLEPKLSLTTSEQRTIVVYEPEHDLVFIEKVDLKNKFVPQVYPAVPEIPNSFLAPMDKKDVRNFHSIVVQIGCDVELFKGDKCQTELLQSELSSFIDFEISSGVLTIGIVDGKEKEFRKLSRNKTIEVELTMKELKSVVVQGAAVVHSDDDIPTSDLGLTIQGSGDLIFHEISPKSYSIKLSGSGDVSLKGEGSAAKGEVFISGSGDVCIPNIEAKSVDVRISGSGDVNVNATNNLDVRISGSGDVSYSGNPETQISISGSGDVYKGSHKE